MTEEILQRFVKESNLSILNHSSKAMREFVKEVSTNHESENNDRSTDTLDTDRSQSQISAETLSTTIKRESTLLNSALRIELNREASFYLTTMDGIIEGGKHYLPGKC